MALITSKPIITISKEEMKKHVEDMNKKDTGLEKLSPEKRKLREDVQSAKRHREFMSRVAENEARDLANAVATSEIVSIAVGETIETTTEEVSETPEVNFESMTKKQIDMWAEENLGIQLDRRHTKAKLIEEIKENL